MPRLQRLAGFYNRPVDQLLPRDVSGALAARGVMAMEESVEGAPVEIGEPAPRTEQGRVSIDLNSLESSSGPERDLLRRYLGMIQVQRGDFNGRVITIRSEDLRAIACLFETSTDGMRRRLDELGLRR